MNFPSQILFTDINHGYRAAILNQNSLRLLPLYMVVATYFYCEKVRRTMRTAFVSNLLNSDVSVGKPLWWKLLFNKVAGIISLIKNKSLLKQF